MRWTVFGLAGVAAAALTSAPAEAEWKQYKFDDLGIYKDFPAPPKRSTEAYKAPLAKDTTGIVESVVDEGITYKLEVVDFSKRALEGSNLAFEAAERTAGGLRGSFTVTDFPIWDHGANSVCGMEMIVEKDGIHTVEDVLFNKGKLYIISASVPNSAPGRHSLGLARFMDTSQFYLKGYAFNFKTGHDYPIGDDDPLDRDDRAAAADYKPPAGVADHYINKDGPPPQ